MVITSKKNSTIKKIKSLHTKKGRDKENLYIAEGEKLTREALEYTDVEIIILDEEKANDVKCLHTNTLVVSKNVFEYIKTTVNSQGIMAICKKPKHQKRNNTKFNLFLEDIQDPGNLGAIFRSSEAFGVDTIYLSKGCVDVFNPKTVRATMGSIFRVSFFENESLDSIKEKYLEYIYVGADLRGNNIYDEFYTKKKKIFVVVGNEAKGLSKGAKEICDELVTIPMEGKVESLNASIALSVMISEIKRKMNK